MARRLRQTLLVALAAVSSVHGAGAGSVAVGASAPLRGELIYATCNLPSCTTLALALFELSNASSSVIFDFPYGAYEDGYVADSILDAADPHRLTRFPEGSRRHGGLLTWAGIQIPELGDRPTRASIRTSVLQQQGR
jgi:hypothetical protein